MNHVFKYFGARFPVPFCFFHRGSQWFLLLGLTLQASLGARHLEELSLASLFGYLFCSGDSSFLGVMTISQIWRRFNIV